MRHAWIVGCLLLLTACSNKVTDSAVALTVKYPGYTPLCLRVTASDAAASERRSEELISQSKLATDEDRTLILAVYREKSWSQQLQVEVASYATADCTDPAIETRQLDTAVTLPAKGSVTAALELLAQDADKDGHAARAPGVQGTDCDDTRGTVHPGATAVCDGPANLGTDFNCDGKLDCNGGACTSAAACGSGFCVGGVCCDSACDEPASQCRGAGTCGTGTCTYAVTVGASCDDGSKCTSGDTCSASGTCAGTAKTCNASPGQCFAAAGTCEPSTGDCKYAPLPTTASCDDGKQCTLDDKCNGSGTCAAGTAKTCNTPPDTCHQGTGACEEPTGACNYALKPANSTCDDGNKCTLDDKCNGSGTCVAGTPKTCDSPPSQCHVGTCDTSSGSCNYGPKPSTATCDDGKACTSSDKCDGAGNCDGTLDCPPPTLCKKAIEMCTADGSCQFEVDSAQVGKICREGGKAGTCQADGVCLPLQFSYTVTSNFDPVAIASEPIDDLDITCGATFDSGTTTWTFASGCSSTPPTPAHVVTGGVVVIPVRNLTVNQTLRVVGSRPVVLAVYGDATLNKEILAHSARAELQGGAGSGVRCSGRMGGAGSIGDDGDGSGGGGGGLATAGGLGGINSDGKATSGSKGDALSGGFSPLSGGCEGGSGGHSGSASPGLGGKGGGALQISVAGRLTLGSVVSVSGAGGGGGDSASGLAAGGGGGGGGGMLVVEANELVVGANARITANGGAGGEGADAKGASGTLGASGEDGSTQTATAAVGGDGGADNGGAGGAGAAGSTGPVDGEAGTAKGGGHGAGGGGGGAAGRILLRGASSCSTIPAGAVISPDTSPACP